LPLAVVQSLADLPDADVGHPPDDGPLLQYRQAGELERPVLQ
jgi:hypothetical protein